MLYEVITDLKAVAEVEIASYQFPWSLGIFRDCLLAGYQTLVLDASGRISGYCRITSYNVCYTKLLRSCRESA